MTDEVYLGGHCGGRAQSFNCTVDHHHAITFDGLLEKGGVSEEAAHVRRRVDTTLKKYS